MSTNFKLDPSLVKILFEAVEASGVPRNKFDLSQLVNSKPYLFGIVGSEKRRAIQKQFWEAKRKNDPQYLKLIGRFGVKPGKLLKSELLGGPDDDDEDEDRNEESSDEETEEEEDSSESSGSNDSSISSSRNPSTKDSPTPTKNSTPKKKSTPKNIAFHGKSQPFSSPPKKMQSDTETWSHTTEESASLHYADDVVRRVELLENPANRQLGTKENPYIIIADPERPETCLGFEVALVPLLQVGNFVRSVYHIRHVTTQGMEDDWSATIPHKEFPALANRSVLIRGPSQELWHRRPDLYHEEEFCKQTALIHEAQQTAIKRSIVRGYSYWLVVLPKGTMLENYIISHDSVHVQKGTQEMEKKFEVETDDGSTEWETLYGMDVYWRIAVAGGNMVSDPESATKKRRKKKIATKE